MTSGSYRQIYVKCPFYKQDTSKSITCMGFVDKSSITLGYTNKKDCDIQFKTFCCDKYENCEICVSLLLASDDGEEIYYKKLTENY